MKSESFCFEESFYLSPRPSKHQYYVVFKVLKVEIMTFQKYHQNQFRPVQSTLKNAPKNMVIPVFAERFKINRFLPIYFLTVFGFFSKFIFLGSAGRAEPLMIFRATISSFCSFFFLPFLFVTFLIFVTFFI